MAPTCCIAIMFNSMYPLDSADNVEDIVIPEPVSSQITDMGRQRLLNSFDGLWVDIHEGESGKHLGRKLISAS